MKRFLVVFSLQVLAVVLLASSALAQVSPTTGAIRVHVVDTSGAVVANAPVALVNTTVGLRREAVTEADGSYVFPFVPPATDYQVEVSAPNFAKSVLEKLIVRVSEVTDANIKLQVASKEEQVVVTAAIETVQTTNPTTGSTITGEVIEQLPISRDPLLLVGTDAGVTADPFGGYNVTGSRGVANNYRLNGADANNFEFNGLGDGPVPDPDAVQELKIQTSLFDATAGRSAGGDISLITRSGTSHYHGGAYEFYEGNALTANNWFSNAFGVPISNFTQNNFGGQFGGPVPFLKKTYFFTNYEGLRESGPESLQSVAPVFPATRDAASLAAAFGVPESSIDPVAVNVLNLKGPFGGFLAPGATTGPVGSLQPFFASSHSTFNQDQIAAKLDNESALLGHNNRISLSFYWYDQKSLGPISLGTGQAFQDKFPSYSAQDTFFITNNILNSFTWGFTKTAILGNNDLNRVPISDVGMSRFNSALFPDLPYFAFTDQLSGIGSNPESMPQQNPHVYSIYDTVSISHGKHTIRVGGETRWNVFKFNESFNFRGELFFDGEGTGNADRLYGALPCPSDPTLGPCFDGAIRDMLIGDPDSIGVASGGSRFEYDATDYALFVQDDYRVTPRLTLNLGLRWDLFGNIGEKFGQISSFDISRVPAQAALNGGQGLIAGFLVPASDQNFGVPGVPKSGILTLDKKNFGPRIGFAYDVFGRGKMAVRGGFGMFYSRYSAIGPLQTSGQPPFSLTVQNSNRTPTILSNPFPVLPLPNQFPVFPAMPTFAGIDPLTGLADFTAGGAPASPIFLSSADPNSHTPYEEKWNLTTQYEFLPGWALEVGYVGSHGLKLVNTQSLNAPLLRNDNNPGPGGLDVNSGFNFDARSPVVGISPFSSFLTTNASSWYNGLLVTVSHQYAKGLYFKAAYTYSHALDNQSGGEAGEFDVGGILGNQFLLNQNKGSSDFDVRHRLVLTYVYPLPGPKKGVLGETLGGWIISGVTQFQTGYPFSVEQFTDDFSGFGGFANIVPGCKLYNSGSLQSFANPFTATSYINPNCFVTTPVIPQGATFGPLAPNEGPGNQIYKVDPVPYPLEAGSAYGQLPGNDFRNALRGPAFQEWDMTLQKKFPVHKFLGEAGAITFRVDANNVFNHPSFGLPLPQFSFLPVASIPASSGFGKITGTQNSPRTLQLAVRLNF